MGSNQLRLAVMIGLVFALHFTAAAAQGVVGRWQSPDSEVVIKADGTLTIDGTMFRYRIAGKVFTLIGADGELAMPFELAGDRMSVVINGQLVPLQRVVAGSAARPGATSQAGDLVGKWCYMSNVTASNGGRMSDECFTIYANGTYQYFNETSSSGPYGGTASRQQDAGTWALSGSNLVVNSRSQGRNTYPLAKRNHPKTNDPMLCLDGRCFVTYGPKEPWR